MNTCSMNDRYTTHDDIDDDRNGNGRSVAFHFRTRQSVLYRVWSYSVYDDVAVRLRSINLNGRHGPNVFQTVFQ